MVGLYGTAASLGLVLALIVVRPGRLARAASEEGESGQTWLALVSLRFWAWGLLVFGCAGLILSTLGRFPNEMGLAVSVASGFLSGGLAAFTTFAVRRYAPSNYDRRMIGAEATVTAGLDRGSAGSVIWQGDESIELPAFTEEAEFAAKPGDKVLIVSIERGRARVTARD
jgi:hypothetical protein